MWSESFKTQSPVGDCNFKTFCYISTDSPRLMIVSIFTFSPIHLRRGVDLWEPSYWSNGQFFPSTAALNFSNAGSIPLILPFRHFISNPLPLLHGACGIAIEGTFSSVTASSTPNILAVSYHQTWLLGLQQHQHPILWNSPTPRSSSSSFDTTKMH